MNNVCSSVIAIVNATALVAPTNKERNEPIHVGHAINKPVAAPILPKPPLFFVIEIAFTANAVFVATRYDTVTCNSNMFRQVYNNFWHVTYRSTTWSNVC